LVDACNYAYCLLNQTILFVIVAVAFVFFIIVTMTLMLFAVLMTMTFMTFFVVVAMAVTITFGFRVKIQNAVSPSHHSRFGIANNTGINLDTTGSQAVFSSGSDTTADQGFNVIFHQEIHQSTVAGAVTVNNFRTNDLFAVQFKDLKFFAMAKMLINLTIGISYCNFHFFSTPLKVSHIIFCFFIQTAYTTGKSSRQHYSPDSAAC